MKFLKFWDLCTGRITRDRHYVLSPFVVVAHQISKDFTSFGGGICDSAIPYQDVVGRLFVAVVACAFPMSTRDTVVIKVYQLQKDRDEHARCEFTCVI